MEQKKTNTFEIKFLYSGSSLKDIPISKTPEFILVGRSNVGKSSLINFLSGQKKLAFVSSTPGRTQTINIFSEKNNSFLIADLPGYGFAKTSKKVSENWAESIREYFEKRKNIVCVLLLIDIRREILSEDKNLVFWFQQLGYRVVCVQTKCDKVTKSFMAQQKIAHANALFINPDNVISISVHNKIGLDALCNQFTNQVQPS